VGWEEHTREIIYYDYIIILSVEMICAIIVRFLASIVLLGTCALLVLVQITPLYSKDAPYTTVGVWQSCETIAGITSCFRQYVQTSAQCSEMDERTSMLATLTVIWGVNNLNTIGLMIWELFSLPPPLSNLRWILFGWSGGTGLACVILLWQTLIANLCSSPLSFNQQGGTAMNGALYLTGALGTTTVAFLLVACAPDVEDGDGK